MRTTPERAAISRRGLLRWLALAGCSLALLDVAQAHGQGSQSGSPATPLTTPGATATLEACVTAALASERSATFAGEMTAVAGTARMSMRVDVEERMPEEGAFQVLTPSGVGVWRSSDPKVKVYKYLKQVSNLGSPAVYRAMVHFRWLNSKGHLIKRADRLTPACAQLSSPLPSSGTTTAPPASG
jgi:hypothetical protein